MLNKFLKMNQPVCVALWIVIFYNLVVPLPGVYHSIFLYALPILVIGHFIEWLILRRKLSALGYDGSVVFAKVMVYGLFWWIPVLHDSGATPSAD